MTSFHALKGPVGLPFKIGNLPSEISLSTFTPTHHACHFLCRAMRPQVAGWVCIMWQFWEIQPQGQPSSRWDELSHSKISFREWKARLCPRCCHRSHARRNLGSPKPCTLTAITTARIPRLVIFPDFGLCSCSSRLASTLHSGLTSPIHGPLNSHMHLRLPPFGHIVTLAEMFSQTSPYSPILPPPFKPQF